MTGVLYPNRILFLSVIFLQSVLLTQNFEVDNSAEESCSFYFQHYYDTEMQVSTNIQLIENSIRTYYSGIWWVSPNLNISGTISPARFKNDINLYYQSSIGYIPQLKLLPWVDTSFNTGINRLRYLNEKNYRWYHAALYSSTEGENQFISAAWIYLFNKWHTHIFQIEYNRIMFEKFQISSGIKLWSEDFNIQFQPLIKLLVNL